MCANNAYTRDRVKVLFCLPCVRMHIHVNVTHVTRAFVFAASVHQYAYSPPSFPPALSPALPPALSLSLSLSVAFVSTRMCAGRTALW
jgi:hypothetical protein